MRYYIGIIRGWHYHGDSMGADYDWKGFATIEEAQKCAVDHKGHCTGIMDTANLPF